MISGYRDADERCRQSMYKEGLKQEEKKDYVKAVKAYEQIPGYSDADDRKLLAMYSYCVEKKDDPTDDVYTYLDELTASGYSGTEALKADIYAWKGDLTWHPAYSMGNMQGANIELTSPPPIRRERLIRPEKWRAAVIPEVTWVPSFLIRK